MDENNKSILRGEPVSPPEFSHESRGERFMTFPIAAKRSSGAVDVINVVAPQRLLETSAVTDGDKIQVIGELRSFNNKSGVGSRLVISLFAKEITATFGDDENSIELRGTLCKAPTLRRTPMGREICDLMVAVNRRYGRSDYLPCITWGARARECALWQVGDAVALSGRMQSRSYIKKLGALTEEKTAYEVSVLDIERVFPNYF
jgi:primosomal replication protein N